VYVRDAGIKYRGSWEDAKLKGWALAILQSGEKIKQFYDRGIPAQVSIHVKKYF